MTSSANDIVVQGGGSIHGMRVEICTYGTLSICTCLYIDTRMYVLALLAD